MITFAVFHQQAYFKDSIVSLGDTGIYMLDDVFVIAYCTLKQEKYANVWTYRLHALCYLQLFEARACSLIGRAGCSRTFASKHISFQNWHILQGKQSQTHLKSWLIIFKARVSNRVFSKSIKQTKVQYLRRLCRALPQNASQRPVFYQLAMIEKMHYQILK